MKKDKEKLGRLALALSSTRPIWGLIPLRFIFGVTLILEGLARFTFVRAQRGALVDQLPGEWAFFILVLFSVIEIVAGILIIPGLFSRFAGGIVMVQMTVALFLEGIPLEFTRDMQTQILLIGIASMIFISGAGRHSMDWIVARELLKKYPSKKREIYTLAETPFTKWWE